MIMLRIFLILNFEFLPLFLLSFFSLSLFLIRFCILNSSYIFSFPHLLVADVLSNACKQLLVNSFPIDSPLSSFTFLTVFLQCHTYILLFKSRCTKLAKSSDLLIVTFVLNVSVVIDTHSDVLFSSMINTSSVEVVLII